MPQKYPDQAVLAEVYLALGDFYYFKARQIENAMLAYKNSIEQTGIEEPILARGMSSLIRCYFELRLWNQALQLSQSYIEKFPLAENAFDIRIQIGTIYSNLHEYDRAIAYLRTLKPEADRESEPRIQYWIGDCYMEKGQFEKAIAEYLKVKYISKPSKLNWAVTAQYKSGIAYMKLGQLAEAKNLFEKIVVEQGAESPFGRGAKEKINEIEKLMN